MSFIEMKMKWKTQHQQQDDLDLAFVVVSSLLFYYSFGLFWKQRHIIHSVETINTKLPHCVKFHSTLFKQFLLLGLLMTVEINVIN